MRVPRVILPNPETNPEKRIFWGLFATSVLRNLATGMIVVFLPVYLFSLKGLWLAIWWMAVTRLVDAVMMKDYAGMVGRLGFKKSVLIGQLLWVAVIYLVNLSESNLWVLLPAAILSTTAASAYWIPYHLMFMQTSEKTFGKKASLMNIFSQWAAAAGPIIGGLLTVEMGFGGVFWFSAAVMAAAAVPILVMEPDGLSWNFHPDHYWQKISGKWFRRDLLAFVGVGIEQAMYSYFWPVFLLIVLKDSYLELGVYRTAVLAVTTVLELAVGKRIDTGGTRKLMITAAGVMGVLWVLRGMFSEPWKLLGVDILDGWLGVMVFLPFSVYTYRRAVVSDRTTYLVESETSSRIGGFLAAVGVGILYSLGFGWPAMVGLGALGTVMMGWLPKIGPKQMEKYSARGQLVQ